MHEHIAPNDRVKLCRGEIKPSEKDIERFWIKVDKQSSPHGCWLWRGAKIEPKFYGVFGFRGQNMGAHRFSWVVSNGPIPAETPWVLHNCPEGDNPSCVNPSHLWLGTQDANTKDMVSKGRQACGANNGAATCPWSRRKGELHGNHKLTTLQVLDIKSRLRDGKHGIVVALAKEFGVSISQISKIRTKRSWAT